MHVRGLRVEARTPRGTAHILRGVDLHVPRGRMVGVVGESGSGKSTLALALLRLLPDSVQVRGEVLMDGADLLQLPELAMQAWRGRRIAMVFQDPATALNPLFTVGTHLVDVLRQRRPELGRRAARTEAEAALRRVEIADPRRRLDAYPHELSGGMRQRVLIAMALLAQPDLLLADEPTTALDATVEAGIMALFDGLRTSDQSILFISHHLGLVAQSCDDLVVLYAGAVMESGPAAAVCRAPKHPYTAALLACELDGTGTGPLLSIPGDVPDPADTPPGCLFASRCAHAEDRCRAEPQAPRTLAQDWQAACWKAA